MNMKKVLKSAVIGAAMLGLVSAAGAANLELNLYGASAQHKYWNSAVPTFLATPLPGGAGCADSVTYATDAAGKHGISVGTQCDITGTDADTITVRYSSKNSSYGIGVACNIQHYSDESGCIGQPGHTKMCAGPTQAECESSGRVCKQVHLGASDVKMTSFTQNCDMPNTFPYTYDETCPSLGSQSVEYINAGCPAYLDGYAQSVVVPFGFIANNEISKWRCTQPGPTGPGSEHYQYPHWGWQCDPSKTTAEGYNEDCIGYYKCFDSGNVWGKTCGGADPATSGILGDTCAEAFNCPNDISETRCETMPIDNLSRLMVLQIFSGNNATELDYWDQFGPWYPHAHIVRCMRCPGSGTHATFDYQVFRGDATLAGTSIYGRFYHHASSTDLVRCVNYNGWPPAWGNPDDIDPSWNATGPRYAVGYVDADKIISMDDEAENCHVVKYTGVEPVRAKIENNEYNFWAAQSLYWNIVELADSNNDVTGLAAKLVAFSQAQANLELIGEPRSLFWTTLDAMNCEKTPDESNYPTVVPGSGGGPF